MCDHSSNPADALYCINCGEKIAYEGATQRLETEGIAEYIARLQNMAREYSTPSKSYPRREIAYDDIDPQTWCSEDLDAPLYITHRQLNELMRSEYLFSTPYADYVEIGTFLGNERRKILVNREVCYSYYGREVIVIDD